MAPLGRPTQPMFWRGNSSPTPSQILLQTPFKQILSHSRALVGVQSVPSGAVIKVQVPVCGQLYVWQRLDALVAGKEIWVLQEPAKQTPGTLDLVQVTKSRGRVHVPFFSSQRVHAGQRKGQV